MGENTVNTPLTMARTTSALLREAERNAEERTVASPRAYHAKETPGKSAAVAGAEEADVACRNGLDEDEEMACTQHGSVDKGRRSSACENDDGRFAWTRGVRRETGEGSEFEVKTRRNADDDDDDDDGAREGEEEVRSARKVKRRRRDQNDAVDDDIVRAEGPLRRNSSSTAAPALPGKTDMLASLPDEVRHKTHTHTHKEEEDIAVGLQQAPSARDIQDVLTIH